MDDFMRYDEDYEQVSDWDESSDHGATTTTSPNNGNNNHKSPVGSNTTTNGGIAGLGSPTNASKLLDAFNKQLTIQSNEIESKMNELNDKYGKSTTNHNYPNNGIISNHINNHNNGNSNNIISNIDTSQIFSSNPKNIIIDEETDSKYEILTYHDILSKLSDIIDNISNTLHIDAEIVSLLLRNMEWKQEKLFDNYMKDSVKTIRQFSCHLCDIDNIETKTNDKSNTTNTANNTNNTDTTNQTIECAMCLEDIPIVNTLGLKCDNNHRYCRPCWYDYIKNAINTKSYRCVMLHCPGHQCKTPVKDSIIKDILLTQRSHDNNNNTNNNNMMNNNGMNLWKKYQNFLVESYRSCFEYKIKHCPKPGCCYVIHGISAKEFIPKVLPSFPTSQIESDNNGNNNNNSNKSSVVTKTKSKISKKTTKKHETLLNKDRNGRKGNNNNNNGNNNNDINSNELAYNTSHLPKITRLMYGEPFYVQCLCSHSFCFTCGEEYHSPATCNEVMDWKLKCGQESDNAQWIVTNTKKCPKCFTRIEKDHGCNHMICYKCQFEFCWVCLGSWKEHGIGTGGYYRCNKYKPKEQLGNKMKLQSNKDEELDKFVHYYNRFHNHAQSRQFLSKNSHKVIDKIKQHLAQQNRSKIGIGGTGMIMFNNGNSNNNNDNDSKDNNTSSNNAQGWIDVEFLQKAHDEIFFCRQVLKYTYVFAYYLENGKEKDLFEFLQQDLEKNCEILHELSEQSFKNLDKRSILQYTNITRRFVKQLLDGVRKGLTN